MGSSTTSNVYVQVIEDVISKVRDEFINNGGPGDGVLNELQGLWELKMMQAGAILGPIDRSNMQKGAAGGPVHDLNVPYEGTEEFETPTADLLFPPTPLQTPMQTPLPGAAQTPLPGLAQTPLPATAQTPLPGSDSGSLYNIPTGGTPITPNEYTSTNDNGGIPEIKAGPGRPGPYMPPPSSWLNQRPSLDVNVAYVEGREEGERGGPRQQATQDFFMMPSGKRKREDFPPHFHASGYIPQQDGAGDLLSDELKVFFVASYNLTGQLHLIITLLKMLLPGCLLVECKVVQGSVGQMLVQGGISLSRIPQLDGPIPDPYDDALSTPNGEDLNTTHLVLAQFDKVTRTKSRWKCTLKDGIMHINNKDILFNKVCFVLGRPPFCLTVMLVFHFLCSFLHNNVLGAWFLPQATGEFDF
ncbi:hypothetical protein BUALT_Bualt02G0069500 [Buddleja alternifolia]|uniref:Uncharacterized protein n=1 Tax=Buddleja alternifolia TaxID=168488 RepID=A0AAV6Y978_9LAMI|nr:hypothetical protein BUALT_Bualt02G0069500 [Buddleja alternifolia]